MQSGTLKEEGPPGKGSAQVRLGDAGIELNLSAKGLEPCFACADPGVKMDVEEAKRRLPRRRNLYSLIGTDSVHDKTYKLIDGARLACVHTVHNTLGTKAESPYRRIWPCVD
uniref:Uncharacterized protein n=1 Tax=Coccolithus braarudii TaxID=221442 RepID=A0A7S0L3R0_9EUKA|mmetsp:Transcript_13373/g.28887  ORF Transcript_13373/g.28887 Transcript_13373/m.28887 type:complete len:112 (+) Transcript_13373:124-459(+)